MTEREISKDKAAGYRFASNAVFFYISDKGYTVVAAVHPPVQSHPLSRPVTLRAMPVLMSPPFQAVLWSMHRMCADLNSSLLHVYAHVLCTPSLRRNWRTSIAHNLKNVNPITIVPLAVSVSVNKQVQMDRFACSPDAHEL